MISVSALQPYFRYVVREALLTPVGSSDDTDGFVRSISLNNSNNDFLSQHTPRNVYCLKHCVIIQLVTLRVAFLNLPTPLFYIGVHPLSNNNQ